MKQQSLASQRVFEKYGRKSRRELFLNEMEKVVPWSGPEALGRAAVVQSVRPGNGGVTVWVCRCVQAHEDSGNNSSDVERH